MELKATRTFVDNVVEEQECLATRTLRYIFSRFEPPRGHLYCSTVYCSNWKVTQRVRDAGYPLNLQLREYGHRTIVTLMVVAFKNMNVSRLHS